MRTKIKFNSIIIVIFFCLLNFIGCGEKKEKTVRPISDAQKTDIAPKESDKAKTDNLEKERLEKIAEPFIKALNDKDIEIRIYAARTLGELKYEKAVEPLIQVLKDENPGCRRAAAWALGEIRA